MPRIFESTHTEEFADNPNAIFTVTISGLTLEEYKRVREIYNREFHPDLYTDKACQVLKIPIECRYEH